MLLFPVLFHNKHCGYAFGLNLKVPTTWMQTTKALARLCLCACSPEPLIIAYVINAFFLMCCLIFHLNCFTNRHLLTVGDDKVNVQQLLHCTVAITIAAVTTFKGS